MEVRLQVGGHNLPFDVDVAEVHFNMPPLPWERMEETMFLLFLNDPHSKNLGLKESAELLLGRKPEERDVVKEWLFAHQDDLHASGLLPMDVRLSIDKKRKPSASGWPQYTPPGSRSRPVTSSGHIATVTWTALAACGSC